jgi:hypothetical protein
MGNEVLIKIHWTSVTSGDVRIRRADPFIIRLIFGWKKPRKLIINQIHIVTSTFFLVKSLKIINQSINQSK